MKTVWLKQVLIALEVCLIAFVSSTLIYFCHLFPLDTLRENIIPKLSFVNKNKGVANRGPLTSKNSWKKIQLTWMLPAILPLALPLQYCIRRH